MNSNPIGILDSGVGGLTIWKEIAIQLPYESTLYIADSKNCPYGTKSAEEIYALARRLVQFLVDKNCKIIVIACNTITVHCLDKLRAEFKGIPIVGAVPVIKTAAAASRNRKIGVLSTSATTNSQYQRDLINRFAGESEVLTVGTDSLVPLVEKGIVSGGMVEEILQREFHPFIQSDIDTLVLGCSHFPFLQKPIRKVLGEGVKILDSAGAIARQVKRVLQSRMEIQEKQKPTRAFYTTGDTGKFSEALKIIGYNNPVEYIEI